MRKTFAIAFGIVFGLTTAAVALASRNSSGTHSLPTGNPVVSGTTITSTWANSTLNDISTELTDSLSRSGKGSMLAPVKTPDGTVAAPAHSFTNEPGTGLYLAAAGDARVSVGSADRLRLGPTASAPAFTFTSPQAAGGTQTDFYFTTNNTRTAGNICDLKNNGTSLFTLPAAGSALLKGTVADGASAVGVVLDNTNALSTSGAKIASFRSNSSEKLSIDKDGNINSIGELNITPGSTSVVVIKGRLAAGSGGADVYAGSIETRNSGDAVFGIKNAATTKTYFDGNGYGKFVGGNPSSSTGFSNTLTPSNIVKAWGYLDLGTSPTCTVMDGFNISSCSYSGYTVTVNFATSLANTYYASSGMVKNGGDTSVLVLKSQNTGSITFGKITGAAATSWDAVDNITFMVVGLQ